jgi:hypothetical protein
VGGREWRLSPRSTNRGDCPQDCEQSRRKAVFALAFARAGNIEQARKVADDLDQDAPLDTLVQNYSLPTIRAAMKLNANDPAGAIAALQSSLKYELSFNRSFNGLYPAYIRGLAYLQLDQGRLAAAGVSEIGGSQGFGGNRRDWGASTFADGQGAENDGRRSLRPQVV